MKIKVFGGILFFLFIALIIFMIFFVPPELHVAMQFRGPDWSVRSVVPAENTIFVAEHMQTYSKGGRRVLRYTTINPGQGSLQAQCFLYGDVQILGITNDGLLWVDRMSKGGVQAVALPNLDILDNAGNEIIFADNRFLRPRHIYVDQNRHLIIKARDGLTYRINPTIRHTEVLKNGINPPAQLRKANTTWFSARTGAGHVSFPRTPERRQLRFNSQKQPPEQGYLNGRLLGDSYNGGALTLRDGGLIVLHQTELGEFTKFRLTSVSSYGKPGWTTDAKTLLPKVPCKNYRHEIQWASLYKDNIILYTLARKDGSGYSTWTHLIYINAVSGRPIWMIEPGKI